MIKTKSKKIECPKAGEGERTQCSQAHAKQIQHAKRSIKPNCRPTSNSIEKMDSSKRTFEKSPIPKENYRLFLSQWQPLMINLKMILTAIISRDNNVERELGI